jgi:hypothetical protein
MTYPGNEPKSEIFFKDLEQSICQGPIKTLRINSQQNKALGILIFSDHLDDNDVQDMLEGIIARNRKQDNSTREKNVFSLFRKNTSNSSFEITWPGSEKKSIGSEEDYQDNFKNTDSFSNQLYCELDRVKRTRLPCSLIIIEVKRPTLPRKNNRLNRDRFSTYIKEQLNDTLYKIDLLSEVDPQQITCLNKTNQQFAIALPGTNLGKAIGRAEDITKRLRENIFKAEEKIITPEIWTGIGIYYPDDRMTSEEFLESAATQVNIAKKKGKNTICHVSGIRKEDSCQVTVEERAQLFSFLTREVIEQ